MTKKQVKKYHGQQLTKKERNKGMKFARMEGAFATAMSALTISFIPAFALALGASEFFIGLLTSIPLLANAILQIPASYLAERTGKRRTICTISSFFSRVMWIPILLIPFLFGESLLLLIVFFSIFHGISGIISPSWASLMGDIVPGVKRGRYFGLNHRIFAVVSLLAVLFAGYVLDFFSGSFIGFGIIFGAAGIFGVLTSFSFKKFPEPKFRKIKTNFFSDMKNIFGNLPFKYFVVSFALFNFGYHFSAPFFVVKLIRDLNAPYIWISILSIMSTLIIILVQRLWGRLSDSIGNKSIIILCAFGIATLPFGWALIPTPVFIIPLGVISGLFWAGFNLSSFNYMLGVASERRTLFSAVFWALSNIGIVAGSLIGGISADYLSTHSLFIFQGLEIVFLISGTILVFSSLLFFKFLEELAGVKEVSVRYVGSEFIRTGVTSTFESFRGLRDSSLSLSRSVWDNIAKIKNIEFDLMEFLPSLPYREGKKIEKDIREAEEEIVEVQRGYIRGKKALKELRKYAKRLKKEEKELEEEYEKERED